MKKSKLIALILTFIFIFTACGDGGSGYIFSISQQFFLSNFHNQEGALFIKNINAENNDNQYRKIHYLDFESGESTVFCTKPGCTHEDADGTCWGAINYEVTFFIAQDKFYSINLAIENTTSAIATELYVSDINRQNKRLVETYQGIAEKNIFTHKNIVVLPTTKYEVDDDGVIVIDEVTSQNLIVYDCLEEKTLAEIQVIIGYESELSFAYGVYNDKIYYRVGSFSEKVDWSIIDEEGGHEKLFSQKRFEYIALDTQTQEIQRSDTLSELLGIEIEIETPQFIIGDVLYYDTGGVIYAYNLNTNENDMVYDGEYEYTIQAGDKLIYHINWLENNSYIYDPKTKESRRIYRPENGDWAMGTAYGLWYEHGDYIYIDSASNVGAVERYEQYDPFIIKVHKDDIYKEEYEAEIVS